jgi:putative SOS response-associated peptidase YedK
MLGGAGGEPWIVVFARKRPTDLPEDSVTGVEKIDAPLRRIEKMCGRYNLRTPLPVLARQFQFDFDASLGEVGPRYNIAPTQEVLAVRHPRQLVALKWGLIPSWAKDAKIGYSTINACAETVATKPAFRAAFKKRRCLVLADGYYEWLSEGKEKQPFLFEVDGGAPFAFAGLWESCHLPGEQAPRQTFSLITTSANELARVVHNRMPVILDAADYDSWLDAANDDVQSLQTLLRPFAAERMTSRPVSRYVNNARHEGPECVASPGG